jgi:hypothetical protein
MENIMAGRDIESARNFVSSKDIIRTSKSGRYTVTYELKRTIRKIERTGKWLNQDDSSWIFRDCGRALMSLHSPNTTIERLNAHWGNFKND